MRQRRRRAVGLALAAGLLTGCPAGDPPGEPDARSTAKPPAPAAPIPEVAPPEHPYPLTTLRAAVDLADAVPGGPATTVGAVPAPDGGAFVVLDPAGVGFPPQLATVGPADGGAPVVRSVPLPNLSPVWDVHLLDDGRVLVSGQFRGKRSGYGFAVVDPATGDARTSVVIPYEPGTDLAHGESALSPHGVLHLFLSSYGDGRPINLLYTADPIEGGVLGGRDVAEEVDAVSIFRINPYSAWLLPRRNGGVHLVFDAYPTHASNWSVPTVLSYDDVPEPVGPPLVMTELEDAAQVQAATVATDGTVWVSAEVLDGHWMLSAKADGAVTRELVLAGHAYDEALAVDPAREWVLLPAAQGARAIHVGTGGTTTLDLSCPSAARVQELVPGRGDGEALLLGQCADPGVATPMLWFVGPAP